MTIQEHSCFSALCDECGDGWDEGPWHFDSREELLKSLAGYGWVAADRILCQGCAREADCEATGHRWEDWEDRQMEGVPYRSRCCEHCTGTETDPPFEHLSDMVHVARTINGLGGSDE